MAGEPSHVDLSVLWVPIMPETSKLGEQMEKAGKDATESFGKGSEKLGDKITESVQKSSKKVEDAVGDVGEKASQQFGNRIKGLGGKLADAIGPDAKKMLGDRLEDTVGGALDGVLGDKSKWGGKLARSIGDWGLDEVKTKLGGIRDSADKAGQAVGGIADGNKGKLAALVGNFGNIKDAVQKTGVEIGDLPQPLQDVVNKTTEVRTQAQGISTIFEGLPGKIGAVIGPLSLLGSAMYALRDQEKAGLFDKTDASGHEDWWKFAGGVGGSWLEKQYNKVFHGSDSPKPSGPAPTPSDMLLGPGGSGDQASANFTRGGDPKRWAGTLGSGSDAYDFFSGGQPLPSAPSAPSTSSSPSASASASVPDSFAGSFTPSASSPAELHASGSRVANLYRVAQALQGTPYSQALRNDCSGMVSKLATAALGMSPSVQFSTVNEGDWLMSHGFQPGVGPAGSFQVGWYDHGGGNAGHTAATLPNGMNAESGGGHGFQLGGSVGANDPQFSQHAWLPMNGAGGAYGGKTPPLGSKDDPLYTSSAAAEDGSGSGQDAAQQLGSGFLGGIMQSVGLDGSVFKTFGGASNPLDFGATKMATGLLNWGMGMAQQKGGGRMPGMGGSIPGAAGLGESPTRGSGGYTQNNHYDNSFTVNGPTDVPSLKNMQNAQPTPYAAPTAGPAFSGLP